MGTIVSNTVKTTILRLQRPPACSVMEPIAIEKLETFNIDRWTLACAINKEFGVNISPTEAGNWSVVGDVIGTAEKYVAAEKLGMAQEYGTVGDAVKRGLTDRPRLIEKLMK